MFPDENHAFRVVVTWREQRPNSQMVTLVGWGLFSLSSTLATLMGAVALALALGLQMQLPDAPLF